MATEPSIGPEGSPGLRDRLLAELKELSSTDDAANWAHRSLRAKNALTAADAKSVEDAFEAKLATLATRPPEGPPSRPVGPEWPIEIQRRDASGHGKRRTSQRIDKTMLGLPEPRRVRDRDHIKSVAKQACLVCGRLPSDAHHLRFAQNRALGRKVSDEFTVPCVGGTIVRSIAAATRVHGGECRHRPDGQCALPVAREPSASGGRRRRKRCRSAKTV